MLQSDDSGKDSLTILVLYWTTWSEMRCWAYIIKKIFGLFVSYTYVWKIKNWLFDSWTNWV